MIFSFLLAVPLIVYAGCKSDCRYEYDSTRSTCNLLHNDPDDADALQMCLRNAQSEYDDCMAECDS